MTALLRVVAVAVGAILLWSAGASRVPRHEKLSLGEVVPGGVMTQPFGCSNLVLEPFDPYCPSRHIHTGVDLAAKAGTPVRAAGGGVVSVGFDPGGAGLYVAVMGDGQVRQLYCHLSVAVVVGAQHVAAGQLIGDVGSTGLSTGPHLHFEVQVHGRAVDPVIWLAS